MAHGTYALAVLGFKCTTQTWDDALQLDGKGDEVFFASELRRVSGTDGSLLAPVSTFTSRTMGDTNGQAGRILAGSLSPLGGIRSGDRYPDPIPVEFPVSGPPNFDFPPYIVWQGRLEEGSSETVFVTTTLWESDGTGDALGGWAEWLASANKNYGQRAKDIAAKVYPASAPIFDAVSLGIEILSSITGLWGPVGSPRSRPIGLARVPGSADEAKWQDGSPLVVALTYETAEYLLTINNGVISQRYLDDPQLVGDYTIYLKLFKAGDDQALGDLPADAVRSFQVPATGAYVTDGGATLSGFVPTGVDNDELLATISGWQPDGGSHPTSLFVKRASQSGRAGIWFRINFVGDFANGVVWITLFQGGTPRWGTAAEPTSIAFNAAPFH